MTNSTAETSTNYFELGEQSSNSRTVEVLHIEDNLADFQLTRYALVECETKFNIRNIASGDEAEAALLRMAKGDERKPDMILLDLDLPKVSGYELFGIIMGEDELATIPVIILTGLVYAESLLGGYRSSVNRILSKPACSTEYLELVQEVERVWRELEREEKASLNAPAT